jgi:hypothetical protein
MRSRSNAEAETRDCTPASIADGLWGEFRALAEASSGI